MTDQTSPGADETATMSSRTRVMALALWAVVGSLLVYGVAETVVKASALFG